MRMRPAINDVYDYFDPVSPVKRSSAGSIVGCKSLDERAAVDYTSGIDVNL